MTDEMKRLFSDVGNTVVLIRGAGEQATGVAHRLFKAGFKLCFTEIAEPLAVRREVSFCEAVYDGEKTVEGVTAKKIDNQTEIAQVWQEGKIPLLVDPENRTLKILKPHVLIDAILAKYNVGTAITDAPLVIGLGPGFTAGKDVHIVIETNRGHDLGRVIFEGEAEPNTGVPGVIAGYGIERVLRASADGIFHNVRAIGDQVEAGDVIAEVEGKPVKTVIAGVVRGLLREGIQVTEGLKAGDVDSRANRQACFTISDKARALGGAALEGILYQLPKANV
ncbi:MAG: EF2563 family selenium-dependent molybdenum hydroxylase system protein [Syntrophaceae bacterium]|nr:EF2563 family selenium-dependent molybdenum hydroxylase system protein [Syntrophaceae bacterium]